MQSRQVSRGLLALSRRCAEAASATMAIALGCIGFSITTHLHVAHSRFIGGGVGTLALLLWFGIGMALKRPVAGPLPEREFVDLHTKIDQMLTEARVILPGVQSLMGFQLIVIMIDAFGQHPSTLQAAHLVGLAMTTLSTLLLLTPAAVHRVAFSGEDNARFHAIGTRLVSTALIPLAVGMSVEMLVGTWRLFESPAVSCGAGVLALAALLGVWYALPRWLQWHTGKAAG